MNLKIAEEFTGEPFIDQNAAMLRVIAELDDIEVLVFAFYEMGLSAPTHFSDQAMSANGHRQEPNERIRLDQVSKKEFGSRNGRRENREPAGQQPG